MWRQEFFHPLLSHFPIVLLTIAPCLYIAQFFVKKVDLSLSRQACLYGGSLFYFMTMFTGDEAFGRIKSQFCYVSEVMAHEQSAENGLIALIIVLIFDIASLLVTHSSIRNLLKFSTGLSLCALVYFLIQTSHDGAMLVYERGAGVATSTAICE